MSFEPGKKLAHYEILEPIGKGGMGEVYRAKDSKLGRDVAIKVLPEEFSHDEERLARFKREAKVLASLNHPRIASIYGLEESEGAHFLVLELIEGETLEERIRRGPIPVEEALGIASKIADALGEAHERGIVHRDLKPANIKLTPDDDDDDDDDISVLDFGLAKALAEDATEADVASSMSPTIARAGTRLGVILGTAAYMSPEQAKGKRVDRRTDVFAFGCVLYEMLTGRKAFEGDVVSEVIASVLAREPDMSRLPANLNPRIRELLARCLEKEPKKRWQAVGDLRVEIDSVLEDPDRGIAATTGISVRGHIVWALVTVAAAIVAAVVATRLAPTPEDTVRRFVLEPRPGQTLATNPLPGNDLALSPDGAQLVYAALEDGIQQLFLHPIDAFQADAIPETEGAYAPFFSPDGQWVGFFMGSALYKVQIPGGTPLRILDIGVPNVAGGSWGPDDTIVVGFRVAGLARASASGGEVEILAVPDLEQGESQFLWPHILPGGRAAVFTIFRGPNLQNARLALVSLDTGERRLLSDEEGYAAQYVSTGHLVYGRSGIVMAVPFDLESHAVSGTPVQMLHDVFTKQAGAQSITVSEEGTLAFIPGEETVDDRLLVWLDRAGTATPLEGAPQHSYHVARLSPNGERIVVRTGAGASANIFVYDIERSTLAGLVPAGANVTRPVWTHDSQRVTFRSSDGSIQWRRADGSGTAEVLLEGEDLNPVTWSPDGSMLAYHDEMANVFLLRDGAGEPFLTTTAAEIPGSFSPDGRYLAYTSSESGRREIYVRTAPDAEGGRWQVSTGGGDEAVFSGDGSELFYRNPNAGKMIAVRIELAPTFTPGEQTELFSDRFRRSTNLPAYDYDVEKKRFLMVQWSEQETLPRIHVVLNWSAELERLVPTEN